GVVRLLRASQLRSLGVAFLLLVGLVLVLGGKPYYVAGFLPLLLAAGTQPFLDSSWRWAAPLLMALSAPAMVVALPLLPLRAAGGEDQEPVRHPQRRERRAARGVRAPPPLVAAVAHLPAPGVAKSAST